MGAVALQSLSPLLTGPLRPAWQNWLLREEIRVLGCSDGTGSAGIAAYLSANCSGTVDIAC